MRFHHQSKSFRPSLSLTLLIGFLVVLLLTGGASRADALGQVVVRTAAWLLLIIMALLGERPLIGTARPVCLLLLATVLLVLAQIVPLPPDMWQALPGRSMLKEAAAASGQAQPWRPWSIVPGATWNAFNALIVPVTMLFLVLGVDDSEKAWLPGLILGLVAASAVMALLQVSGVGIDNPFINESAGQVSGTFANRNHLALFLAVGCLVAPVWATLDGRRPGWRGPVAFGLMLLFALTVLASGSRAGLLLTLIAFVLGPIIAHRGIQQALRNYPRWVFPALVLGVVAVLAIFVLISIAADRAVSIDRIFAADQSTDMRRRGLPTVLSMIRLYFPMGTGLGSFDPMFRLHEPLSLLKLTYFNHAHNDFIEVMLDAGMFGALLLVAALSWWAWAGLVAWRAGWAMRHALPRLGSATLFLIIVASAFDYPARTPAIMATSIIAALWLSGWGTVSKGSFTAEPRASMRDGSPGKSGKYPTHA